MLGLCGEEGLDAQVIKIYQVYEEAVGLFTNKDASIHRLNATGRALNDHIVAMNIDNPSTSGAYTYRVLKPIDFAGVNGDGRIHVVGMTGTASEDRSEIRLWLINARPSVDALTGELLDNAVVGGNSTIEVFTTEPGANSMKHVQTFANPQIATPNNVAVTKDGGFFFTNDHGPYKAGWVSDLGRRRAGYSNHD